MSDDRRIVITGSGAYTGAGPSNEAFRAALAAGGGAYSPFPEPLHLLPPGFGGVTARDLKLLRSLPGTRPLRPSTMTRYTYLSTMGIGLLLLDAGVDPEPDDAEAERRSLFVGSYVNLPEMHKYVGMAHLVRDRAASARGEYAVDDARIMAGMKRFTGFEFLRLMNNMPVAHGAIQARCKGPCNTFMGFASAGMQAVGAGLRTLQDGRCDLALCGGAGSAVIEHALTYKAYRGLLSRAEDPDGACRPFDRGATGIVPGEGAGFVALERADHAAARGAEPRAALLGFATGFATPAGPRGVPADAAGMATTLRAALDDAGVAPGDIDTVVATGYGLPAMDALELAAYRDVFGAHLDAVRWLCPTPVTGFCEASHGVMGLATALAAFAGEPAPAELRPVAPIDGFPASPAGGGRPTRALVAALSMEGSSAAGVVERIGGGR